MYKMDHHKIFPLMIIKLYIKFHMIHLNLMIMILQIYKNIILVILLLMYVQNLIIHINYLLVKIIFLFN